MNKTLLERALEVEVQPRQHNEKYTSEDLELILAWMHGEIRTRQLLVVVGKTHKKSYQSYVMYVLQWAITTGILVEAEQEKDINSNE